MSGYIRLFADTDGGATSSHAIEYARALIRIAPVRLVSVSGPLHPSWALFQRLLETDISGTMLANVVCTDPSKWVRTIRVPMPRENTMHTSLAAGEIAEIDDNVEIAERTIELHTSGTRNVLLCAAPPRSARERETMDMYNVVLVPTTQLAAYVERINGTSYVIKTPVVDHVAFKNFVLGKTT